MIMRPYSKDEAATSGGRRGPVNPLHAHPQPPAAQPLAPASRRLEVPIVGRDVWVTALIAGAGLAAFSAFAGSHADHAQALASSAIFLVLFFPVAALGVPEWASWLQARWAPAPGLRAAAVWVPMLALVAIHAVLSGQQPLKPVAAVALTGAVSLALLGSRPTAASPLDHPLRLGLVAVAIWLPSELGLVHGMTLPPGGGGLEAGRLLGFDLGLLLFVAVAALPNLGYGLRFRRTDLALAAVALAGFASVAIPLGLSIGFIHWAPTPFSPLVSLVRAFGIYFLIAVPEELLFRGVVQNALERHWTAGGARRWSLAIAAVIFGLTHLNNGHAPNIRYAILATLAGVAYGWVWQRSRRITASALTHASVDWIWITLFKG